MPKTDSVGLVLKCPYFHRKATTPEQVNIVERHDFQMKEDGQVDIISLGTFDTSKEVQSHNGEVGLINVLKLAQARGLDSGLFAKTEPGLMVDLSDIDTVDDLIQKQAANTKKLEEIAASVGMTVDELIAAVQNGSEITPKADDPAPAPEGE